MKDVGERGGFRGAERVAGRTAAINHTLKMTLLGFGGRGGAQNHQPS